MGERAFYQPGASSVEGLPLALQMFHNKPLIMLKPHWHAQVEVNFIVSGRVRYRMNDHEISLTAGEMCLFWGGLPHQLHEASDDVFYAGAHLPLVHFFRLHLPADVRHRLMTGAALVTSATDASDAHNFERWYRYGRSGDPAKAQHAVDELVLRLERVRFEPYRLVPEAQAIEGAASPFDQQSSRNVGRMCDFIAENFLYDIDSVDIAAAADIHPKYAMSLFRKSTGMTLNEYVNLLRLSYAQALLIDQDAKVLRVAMESGFGSLSAFNKAFRKLAGMSPSDFRKVSAVR
ncbi:helix-turn-helix domain-containing protein [Mesorhizobium sp. BAC0120]|uniref:helix-turn-helix domain-containing protein n=1 Tax=Mesorhizobium sp. BAC0120 TaxID=3090670 RepID=UPI00298C1153|nr:helix-turn-helix domain-containing protein [Mesorhizobium sp. BAC0120]MDW6025418.1 helix-turn-helix domain-containing protein [Mesorhizobium sp. BAC0120]